MKIDTNVLAKLYDFNPDNIEGNIYNGNYNQSYIYEKDGENFILRVSPPDENISMLRLKMDYLWQHFQLGSPVVEPIFSVNDNLVEQVTDQDGINHLITVSRQRPGNTYEILKEDTINDKILYQLGKRLAILHKNAALLKNEEIVFPDWYDSENCFTIIGCEGFNDQEVLLRHEKYLKRCKKLIKTETNYGVIHGDLHFSNIIIDHIKEKVTFCDFDDACQGYFIMDLALIIFDLAVILQTENRKKVLEEMITLILTGYNSQFSREKVTISQMEDFLKLIEISIFIQCYDFYQEEGVADDWLNLFYAGREDRILSDMPYLSH